MDYLVIVATAAEIRPFLHHCNKQDCRANIDILVTGVGLTATTWALTRQIFIKRPHLVIQAGVAGCFDRNIALGEVAAVGRDCIADQVVEETTGPRTLFDLGLIAPGKAPYSGGWLINKSEALKKLQLKKVRAISVNEISTSRQRIKWYREKYDPVAESMEGAALHYVALRENIPFIQLRAFSNYVGERNRKKWKMDKALYNLNEQLKRMIFAG